MRSEFVQVLCELAKEDTNVFLITGDLGFGVLNPFIEKFPDRYINAGVAEQSMIGLAVGMALEGKTLFVYSIGNFPTLRCLEQIRNDACYHHANVKIVAVGGGLSYGALGVSHHATEDLAMMRSLPEMTVVVPGGSAEAAHATRAIYNTPGACYLRLGRGGESSLQSNGNEFKIGKATKLLEGKDVAIVAVGDVLQIAMEASNQLKIDGIDTGLYNMHTLKPIDRYKVEQIASTTKLIVTVEEHNVIGGLGSAVAEIMAQMPGTRARLKIIGLEDSLSSAVGDQNYLRAAYGLTAENIIENVKSSIL